MRKKSLTVAAGAVVLLGVGLTPAQAAVAGGPSELSWSACASEKLSGLQCSTLAVPVDRNDPNGEKIQLRLGRYPAVNKSKGTILVIPGGPGAGLEVMHTLAGLMRVNDLRKEHDVVTFDPRGVGASAAVACSLPDPPPTTGVASRAEFDRLVASHEAFINSCEKATGKRLSHLSAQDTAEDIEDIRKALGEGGLLAYSGSYGTNYAGAYLEKYGENVKALIMDAVVDHSVRLSTFAVRNARGVESSFRQFTRWCAKDITCALNGQNVTKIVDDLIARKTLPAPGVSGPVTGMDVRMTLGDLFSVGAEPNMGWPYLAKSLRQAKDGDASAFAPHPSTGRGLFRGVLCADFGPQNDYREHAAAAARLAKDAPRFGPAKYWSIVAECVGWRKPATNPPHTLKAGNHPNVLVTSNTHDPATPLSNALAVHKQIPKSKLLVAKADGHQAIIFSKGAFEVMTRFLDNSTSVRKYTYVRD
ncbi:alpha/beta hydrolase [Sinosporangium siamense]|uniref:Alpha/beta hydrolase n=1 Tax=Sinosporangium siamense TaxID=1367973 RepID=A0A919RAZ8_9ACTN|nr:alpha/beta hydrolase [Sinosporangium siamense]GII90610.1 alpha/beta hydrolase [Sinosporangium siamense]